MDSLKNSKSLNDASAVTSDLIISILDSRGMKDRIIDQLNLQKLWSNDGREIVRRKVADSTDISIEKGNIIKIKVVTETPEISMNMANLYLDEIDEFNKKLELSANASIIQILDRAILPEKRMARGTVKKSAIAAIISFLLSCFVVLIIDMLKKTDAINRLKQIKM